MELSRVPASLDYVDVVRLYWVARSTNYLRQPSFHARKLANPPYHHLSFAAPSYQIVGADMVWQQELETKLDGGVISLSVLADSCELLAGTQEGSVYRLLLADLSASKVSQGDAVPPNSKQADMPWHYVQLNGQKTRTVFAVPRQLVRWTTLSG